MSTAKIAISIEQSLLERIDHLVKEKLFPNRSKAIQEAVKEKVDKLDKSRQNKDTCQPEYKVTSQNINGAYSSENRKSICYF